MSQLKAYPEYKDSGVEWIGEIPKVWEMKRIKHEIENLNYKRVPLSADYRGKMSSKKYDYYGASGIIDKVEDYIFNETLILVGEDGANLYSRSSPLAFLATGKYWVNNHAHILKPKKGNIVYFVNLLETIDYSIYVTGSAQPKLTQDAISNIWIPVPPFEEQEEIAKFITKKSTEIDNLISDKERLIELLEEKRQAVITETVTKGLDPDVKMKDSGIEWIGDIPEHWEVVKLKFIGESVMGLLYSPKDLSDYENGTLVLRASNIQSGELEINRQDNVYVNKEIPPKLITQVGDILICARSGSRELIGKSGIVDESTSGKSFGAFTTVFRSDSNEYIKYVFQSGLFKSQIGTYLTSTINQLTMRNLNNLEIVHPTKKDQDDIVNYLNKYVKNINKLMKTNKNQILKLKEYRESLIYEAVTGKIDVRDYAVKTEEVY